MKEEEFDDFYEENLEAEEKLFAQNPTKAMWLKSNEILDEVKSLRLLIEDLLRSEDDD